MKRLTILAALMVALPCVLQAQVHKEVEVTKAFVPKVEHAEKLSIRPNMTDTTRLNPEIDYTVTPLSLQTAFDVKPIAPAKVTYWEFNRPRPYYLKVGAGYPLNSVLDFYGGSQHAATGYLMGYVNHKGQYDKRRNVFGEKNAATEMTNRAGFAAGKYVGSHVFEGEVAYENRYFKRHGAYADSELTSAMEGVSGIAGMMADYSDAKFAVRFGDDFQNLQRTNFEVALRGDYFMDHSDWVLAEQQARQWSLGVDAKIARRYTRHQFAVNVGYEYLKGAKAIEAFGEHLFKAGVRYGGEGRVVNYVAGADFVYDKVIGGESDWYLMPYARVDINLGTKRLMPYVEVDGEVRTNDFRSLTYENPYLTPAMMLGRSSVDYNGRAGIRGTIGRDALTYRLYAGISVKDNHLFWYGRSLMDEVSGRYIVAASSMSAEMDRLTVVSVNGELEWRPLTELRIAAGAHWNIVDESSLFESGVADFECNLGLRYEGRKIGFGVKAVAQTERRWTLLHEGVMEWVDAFRYAPVGDVESIVGEELKAPFAVDLRVNFDWKISSQIGLFAEGYNLANCRLYRYPWYPASGIGFTMGVKMNF